MIKYSSFIVCLLLSMRVFSSSGDTIYFDKNWKECAKTKMSYLRTYGVKDSLCFVNDFYKNKYNQFKVVFIIDTTKEAFNKIINGFNVENFVVVDKQYTYNEDGSKNEANIKNLNRSRKFADTMRKEFFKSYADTTLKTNNFKEILEKSEGCFKGLIFENCKGNVVYRSYDAKNKMVLRANLVHGEIDSFELFSNNIAEKIVVVLYRKINFSKIDGYNIRDFCKRIYYYNDEKLIKREVFFRGKSFITKGSNY